MYREELMIICPQLKYTRKYDLSLKFYTYNTF